ncbi:CocE/NonD family hydrolase C-terminal non-catalytic domain-containing protein [Streptomyces sp. NPDC057027]|uniref:CocE/NonD family hydrolase C-terminal non-catalytic domain-containing protein n=1 Tax=Streptomyces sp. NPDC057027 TaxID=3346004 RepID=UPI00362BBD8C
MARDDLLRARRRRLPQRTDRPQVAPHPDRRPRQPRTTRPGRSLRQAHGDGLPLAGPPPRRQRRRRRAPAVRRPHGVHAQPALRRPPRHLGGLHPAQPAFPPRRRGRRRARRAAGHAAGDRLDAHGEGHRPGQRDRRPTKLVQTGLAERVGLPHVYRTAEINRDVAAVFTAAPLEQAMRIQGDLRLRVTVKPQPADTMIVSYLLETDPATGSARIITNAPYTFTADQAGQAITVDLRLQPAHYVLPKGRRLQLVIDTHDPFFTHPNTTTPVSTLDITFPQGTESYLDVPLAPLD